MLTPQQMSDRLEIVDCLARYSHAVDRHDWELLDTVFLPEAECDYTEIAPFSGTANELKAWLAESMPPPGLYHHLLGTSWIELDGDRAEASTPCLNPMPSASGTPTLYGHWYRDGLTRTPEGWRIARRRFEVTYRLES